MKEDRRMPGAMHSASGFERIEVVTGVERRRRWTPGKKLKAVEEAEVVLICAIHKQLNFLSAKLGAISIETQLRRQAAKRRGLICPGPGAQRVKG